MGEMRVETPMQGTIVSVDVSAGDTVVARQQLMLIESMKMHHAIESPCDGTVLQVLVVPGVTVMAGGVVASVEPGVVTREPTVDAVEADNTRIRPDLAEVLARHEIGLDAARPKAVARRRAVGRRTARENVADLVDDGSFVEFGPVAIAAQRRRRDVDDLIENTPADGMVGGIGTVNGHLFRGHAAQVVVASYDYTVLAGTQGVLNHRKKDRLFELAESKRVPVVFFTEGGGGRPGDTDQIGVSLLDCWAFFYLGGLSGLVPLVGINAGYCFAGNASLLGCCDVVIATADSNIGMAGPAMIEGGGLGVFDPKEIGPMSVQQFNGVVDIAVADEVEAVAVAKQYLSYFQGSVADWACPDQLELRGVVPEDRKRGYDVRTVIDTLFDTGSVLELRRDFALGMVTALARVEGHPVGVLANNPGHLAGAIDSDAADKAARFLQLCDAFDIPVITLVDTPGMMVGPAVEETALVRHCSRLFVTAANITVPLVSVVLRKCYGLGAQAMVGGSTKAPDACIAWPTGEFGPMGLEGAVRLGYRKELEAIEDPQEREQSFQDRVDKMYEHGKALNTASFFEIDDVIDPADTRRWISVILNSSPPTPPRVGKKRPNIDTW
jgi:acetyl-CoA carboxylase carboxyltransferase component